MEYADYLIWVNTEEHISECDNQPIGKECICLETIEAKAADEADNDYHDLN